MKPVTTLTELLILLKDVEAAGYGEYKVGAVFGDYGWDFIATYEIHPADKTIELK